VLLLDVVPQDLTKEERKKGLTKDSKEFRNRLARLGKERILDSRNKAIFHKDLGNLIQIGNLSDDLPLLSETDWVIEAVVEKLEVKQELLSQVNKYRKPGTIVSSNTSGISINKMAAVLPLEFRQHFLGTHFFNPPRWMKLLEIIPSEDCLPELVEFMKEFAARRLGKGVVIAKDTPNFIANRIGTYAYMQVLKKMPEYGFAVNQIDRITGQVIGRPRSATFRTLDMVGLDTFVYVANNAGQAVEDEKENADFQIPAWLQKMVAKGQLGDKNGQGFYKRVKTEKGSSSLIWDPVAEEYVPPGQEALPGVEAAEKEKTLEAKLKSLLYGQEKDSIFAWEVCKKMLLYAAQKATEIANSFEDIDRAMVWGYNWKLGPFAFWDAIDPEKSIARMKEEGEEIPAWVEERLAAGQNRFYEKESPEKAKYQGFDVSPKVIREHKDAVLLDIGDDVACLQFRTKSNVINDGVIEMIYYALEEVKKKLPGVGYC